MAHVPYAHDYKIGDTVRIKFLDEMKVLGDHSGILEYCGQVTQVIGYFYSPDYVFLKCDGGRCAWHQYMIEPFDDFDDSDDPEAWSALMKEI